MRKKIVKKILLPTGIFMGILIILEVLGLLLLETSIARYAHYWKQTAQQSGTYTYVALGDSVAQGVGTTRIDFAYVNLIAQRVHEATGKTVRIINLSVSGAKVQDVIDKQLPQLKNYHPDLVTLDIGGNDISSFNGEKFSNQFDQLAAQLPPGSFVATIPFFGGRVQSSKDAPHASSIIRQTVNRYGLNLVNLQSETQTRQSPLNYSFDYFHPSNQGHKIWRDAFMKAIAPTL